MRESGKDNSGENIYEPFTDAHGHWVVKHDLFNHDGKTKDGIAEAFIEFAKNEGLSFV
jgi:type I restriction enzyme M protein